MATIPFPSNWNTGFGSDVRIAAGGTEVPFLRNGSWFLRVVEVATGAHLLYNYAADMFEAEE
jgi:hypothetical protein